MRADTHVSYELHTKSMCAQEGLLVSRYAQRTFFVEQETRQLCGRRRSGLRRKEHAGRPK